MTAIVAALSPEGHDELDRCRARAASDRRSAGSPSVRPGRHPPIAAPAVAPAPSAPAWSTSESDRQHQDAVIASEPAAHGDGRRPRPRECPLPGASRPAVRGWPPGSMASTSGHHHQRHRREDRPRRAPTSAKRDEDAPAPLGHPVEPRRDQAGQRRARVRVDDGDRRVRHGQDDRGHRDGREQADDARQLEAGGQHDEHERRVDAYGPAIDQPAARRSPGSRSGRR